MELEKGSGPQAYTRERLDEMLDFVSTMTTLFDEVRHLPPHALRGLAKLRGRILKMVSPFAAKGGRA